MMEAKLELQKQLAQKVPDQPLKIAVVGLSNAGKTCLLKTLFHEFDEIEILEPTRKIERSMAEFLHHPLSIWDFGGQSRYMKKYLSSPDKYFKKIEQVFYVVDVQDTNRITNSLDYFERVVESIYTHSPKTQITIIYNKFDPIYQDQLQLLTNRQIFRKKAIEILKRYGFGYQGYKSSKYAPLWVITAFSKSMLDNPEVFDEISQKLAEFANNNRIESALVFTKQGFGLGYYLSDEMQIGEMRDLFIKFFSKFEQMYEMMPVIELEFGGLNIYSTKITVMDQNYPFSVFFGFIYTDNIPLESRLEQECLQEFIAEIQEKIKKIQTD